MLKKVLAAAFILGILALYISQVELAGDVVKAKAEQPFADLKPAQVASLEFGAKGAPSFSISHDLTGSGATTEAKGSKNGGKTGVSDDAGKSVTDADIARWGLAGISGAELDIATLNSLFSALQSLTLKDGIPAKDAGSDLSVYGLAPSELTLGVTTQVSGSATRNLSFGKVNDYVGQRYVQLSGDPALYLIPAELFDVASKKRDDFRNRSPFMVFDGEVKEFSIGTPALTYKFEQGERWRMTSPQSLSVNATVVSEIFRVIRSMRAVEFIDSAGDAQAQANHGLTTPAFTVSVTFKDEKRAPFSFNFGQVKSAEGVGRFAVQRAGSSNILTVETDLKPRVVKQLNDYREKQLASFDTNSVKSVVYKRGSDTVTISQNTAEGTTAANGVAAKSGERSSVTPAANDEANPSSAWLVDGKPGDDPFIKGYFSTLSTLEAKEYLDPHSPQLGFDAPEGTIEITLLDGKVRKIIIGKLLASTRRAVGVDTLQEPFGIDEDMLKRVLPAVEVFLEAQPAETPTPSAAP